jgi:hypothetical protein
LLIGPIVHWKLEPITRMTREHWVLAGHAQCAGPLQSIAPEPVSRFLS